MTGSTSWGAGRRWRGSLIIAATMALLATTAGAGGVLGADPPSGEAIYFYDATHATAMAVRPDGTGLTTLGCVGDRTYQGAPRRALTLEQTGVTFPTVSGSDWWTVRAMQVVSRTDGCGDAVVLWDPGAGYQLEMAAWSLDGTRIAVAGHHFDGRGQMTEQGIWVGEVGGACGEPLCGMHLAVAFPMIVAQRRSDGLIAYADIGAAPAWAPDGRRIVYSRVMDPPSSPVQGIFVADVGLPGAQTASERRVVVTGETRSTFGARISPVPGAEQIAYFVTTSPKGTVQNDIFVVSASGGTARQVTSAKSANLLQISDPTWSPDGLWIAFDGHTNSVNGRAIYKIRADGKSKAEVVVAKSLTLFYVSGWRR